jgi:hypothetical protein
MNLKRLRVGAILAGCAISAFAQADRVPSGRDITVRTNETIDLKGAGDGRIYTGVVDRDVTDSSGHVAIPRGSNAELIVRNINSNERAVDLESITVGGNRYVVAASDQGASSTESEKEGVGKNKRTAKYVGGGAVIGSIIGAIAGGGKGAAIGAIAGGAAGAGAQTITRGRDIHVPAESLLTFRLDRPLELGTGLNSRDNGYDRNGQHYHRYTY